MIITQSLNIEKVSFGVLVDLWRNSCSNDLGPISCAPLFRSAWSACCIVLCCMDQGHLSSVVAFRYPLFWLVSFQDACSSGLCGLIWVACDPVRLARAVWLHSRIFKQGFQQPHHRSRLCVLWVRVRVRVRVRSLLYTPLWGFSAIQDKAIIYYQVYIKNIYLKKKKNTWVSLWHNSYDYFTVRELTNLTEYLTLLSRDWPTDWMIYGWLIHWPADSTVLGPTNWHYYLWLVDWLTNWLYCPWTDQLTDWFKAYWLTD